MFEYVDQKWVYRRIVVMQALGDVWLNKAFDQSALYSMNDALTEVLAAINLGVGFERPVSVELIEEAVTQSNTECIDDIKKLVTLLFLNSYEPRERIAKEVGAMLWIALDEIHNVFAFINWSLASRIRREVLWPQ